MNIDANSAVSQAMVTKMGAPTTNLWRTSNMTPEKADVASKDFESMFISQMVEQMFGDSEGSDAFGSEETDQVYKGLMVQEYGKMITRAGGIGIADYVKKELLKQQEVTPQDSEQQAVKE